MRVLVIEDNASNMELVIEVLEANGFEAAGECDAQRGVQRVKKELPDIVLMDLSLPGLDGLSATRLLRDDPVTAHVPILILTAHAGATDLANARAAGCDGYVTKPIDTRTLCDIVLQTTRQR